jgi:adenine-specific DNA-methyltransferase
VKEEYRQLPIVKNYEKGLAALSEIERSDEVKSDVFNAIYQFLSRYFVNGDFIPLRRYSKQNKYVVPYNGEEVILHWANKGQYFIKASEQYGTYVFRVGKFRIRFHLESACNDSEDIENIDSRAMFFVLKNSGEHLVLDKKKAELTVFFELRPLTPEEEKSFGTNQDGISRSVEKLILEGVKERELGEQLRNETESGETLLLKHLNRYVRMNGEDYFLHPSLESFLQSELENFVKNELLSLESMSALDDLELRRSLNKVSVIKRIGSQIIEFLAQIENFQRKMWEKKKFVIQSNYCMTLDRVPKDL